MSFSTQLTRGTLALPLLALFGALALFGNQPADAQALPSAAAMEISSLDDAGCHALPRPVLMLAQAPADLGPIARRQRQPAPLGSAAGSDCPA